MESHYSLAGVNLRIEHCGDEFFRKMDDELKYYRAGGGEHDCMARFNKGGGRSLPERAVRTNVLNNASVYIHEQQVYIADKDGRFLVRMAVGKRELSVDYGSDSEGLHELVRWLLKWLVIKSAEAKGLVFIHASAASYRGRTVVFCGDSNCGKSSSLMRLVRKGAVAITDDSVLTDGSRIYPFTLKTGVDEDFARRFGVELGLFDIGRHARHEAACGKAECMIFVRIWNSRTSEIRPLEYGRAFLALIKTYKKEIPFLWSGLERESAEGPAAVFRRYASVLEGVKCFEFFQGRDEGEVSSALLKFLDGLGGAPEEQGGAGEGQPGPVHKIAENEKGR